MSYTEEKLLAYYNTAVNLVKEKCAPLFCEGYAKSKDSFKTKSAFYDLVTVYDKQIENILILGLKSEFPESLFIGEEESYARKHEAALTDAPTWIIDPIDGTNNFIQGIPHCCISVGLAINKQLVLGIVYNPITNEMFSARKNHGAYCNGQRIYVSKTTKINDAIVADEMSLIVIPESRDTKIKRLYKLASNAAGTRSLGSAALSICYVASGVVDVYHVINLKPWDIAGAAIVLTEAGGFICNSYGGAYEIMKPSVIASATTQLAKNVIELFKEADEITDFTFA